MIRLAVAIGILHRNGRFFLQRRSLDASVLPGLWEFPGGKLESRETPEEAVLRELREEVGTVPERVRPLPAFRYAYPDLAVQVHPFLCEGGARPRSALAWGWFTLAELQGLPVPEANRSWLKTLPNVLLNLQLN